MTQPTASSPSAPQEVPQWKAAATDIADQLRKAEEKVWGHTDIAKDPRWEKALTTDHAEHVRCFTAIITKHAAALTEENERLKREVERLTTMLKAGPGYDELAAQNNTLRQWSEQAREAMEGAYAGLDGHPAWDDVRNNLKSVYSTHPAVTNKTEEGK